MNCSCTIGVPQRGQRCPSLGSKPRLFWDVCTNFRSIRTAPGQQRCRGEPERNRNSVGSSHAELFPDREALDICLADNASHQFSETANAEAGEPRAGGYGGTVHFGALVEHSPSQRAQEVWIGGPQSKSLTERSFHQPLIQEQPAHPPTERPCGSVRLIVQAQQ